MLHCSYMQSSDPIIDHIQPFLDYCEVEKGLAKRTQRNYKQYLSVFAKWLESNELGDLLPHQVTPDHVWNYRLYLARDHASPTGRGLAKNSQNYYLIALRAFLKYLSERDIDALSPAKVKLAKQQSDDTVNFLEVSDIEKLMRTIDATTKQGLRDRAIIELLFSSGLRVAELVSLDLTDMSILQDGREDRTYELSITGKGGRTRTIFISPRAASWLRSYIETRRDAAEPLFINYSARDLDKKRLSARYIQKMISRTAMLAGISKKVTPHTLRHTYATDLLARGADLRSVQELLGHKNVSTTQVYTHVTNKHLREIHERFHGQRE